MLQFNPSHYSDVYVTVKETITVQGQLIDIKIGLYYLKIIIYQLRIKYQWLIN